MHPAHSHKPLITNIYQAILFYACLSQWSKSTIFSFANNKPHISQSDDSVQVKSKDKMRG